MKRRRRAAAIAVGSMALALLGLTWRTLADLQPLPSSLEPEGRVADVRLLDRNGEPLNATFTSEWNVHDAVALHEIPEFLRTAFIVAEDKRFYAHRGVDWRARLAALATNLRNFGGIRGASTITEQVVRMLHPRPRTVWSRWLEGWEAGRLEAAFGKHAILEFSLNQVPYASNRRGVRQAAQHYFARDLETLSRKEMLALAVLVRAPSRFDLNRSTAASEGAIRRLADTLVARGALDPTERDVVLADSFALESPLLAVSAPHFVRQARFEARRIVAVEATSIATTLDARLQVRLQALLDRRLEQLRAQGARHGGLLVADHTSGEVLAWVVAFGGAEEPASYIDAVTTPRQPGSALKPFLYALALDRGATAAEIIEDVPLAESTSGGLHSYENYSRRFYGRVALRDALGNSLNIPALRTVQRVGTGSYLATLRMLGFSGLDEHPDFYGDGIALGNGAVTLLELVQAYAALANRGVFRPLTVLLHDPTPRVPRRVYSAEAASLVADILADADARSLEFGRNGVLTLPVQTAVKTGTSSDYRDAWAVGFDARHVVGVWIGNLEQTPTDGVSGAAGPALVLRAAFAELTRARPATEPLYLSPRLRMHRVCVPSPASDAETGCFERDEWFMPGTEPHSDASVPTAVTAEGRVRFQQPIPGLELAHDPRLPAEAQAFEFIVQGVVSDDRVDWTIDGAAPVMGGPRYRWPIARGEHRVAAVVWRGGTPLAALPEVAFTVK